MYNEKSSGDYPVSNACLAVLKLSSIKGLGLKTFHQLFNVFSSSEKVLSSSFDTLVLAGIKPKLAKSIHASIEDKNGLSNKRFDRVFEWAEKKDNYVLCLEDELYPEQLKHVFCPPPILYAQGQLDAFKFPSVGVIGSRRPTFSGQKHAKEFAKALAQANICVNSGLAIGVDTFAHQGALEAGGLTCAVLGSGLQQIYPKQNKYLAEAIRGQGVLLSELSLDALALPANFPRRNRIISGLSNGVFVVEAGLKSGSLITAEFAIEQNRDVFAMPGSIDNPLSKGCHSLIKQGAILVESVDDILNELDLCVSVAREPAQQAIKKERNFSHLNKEEQKVISVLGAERTSFDDLMHCLGMDVMQLNTLLVTLELKGELCSVLGGYQRT